MSRKQQRGLQKRRLRAERRQERVEAVTEASRALREWVRSPAAALVFFAVSVTATFAVAVVFGP